MYYAPPPPVLHPPAHPRQVQWLQGQLSSLGAPAHTPRGSHTHTHAHAHGKELSSGGGGGGAATPALPLPRLGAESSADAVAGSSGHDPHGDGGGEGGLKDGREDHSPPQRVRHSGEASGGGAFGGGGLYGGEGGPWAGDQSCLGLWALPTTLRP